MKSHTRFCVWSNYFFLLPIVLDLYFQIYWHAALTACTMIFSIVYHNCYEKNFMTTDKIFANALIAGNLVLLYLSKFNLAYTIAAFAFVAIAFYFFFLEDDDQHHQFNHSMWHIASVVITICCILALGTIV